MSPADALSRARAATAAAELAAEHGDTRTAAAYKAAAASWERMARPGVAWSLEPARQQLRQLKRDFAQATGPFQPPAPPRAPSPTAMRPERTALGPEDQPQRRRPEPVAIEF